MGERAVAADPAMWDLRAPLSVISVSCAVLVRGRGDLPESATKNVDRIQRAVEQMTSS